MPGAQVATRSKRTMTMTTKTTLGTFEYRGCPASTFDARERVLEKLREIEGIDISFGYMLDDENNTLGVRLRVSGNESDAPKVYTIGKVQRAANFRSTLDDGTVETIRFIGELGYADPAGAWAQIVKKLGRDHDLTSVSMLVAEREEAGLSFVEMALRDVKVAA